MVSVMDILISGASVAGPALAYWLNRHGFTTTVVERAAQLRGGGYAVDFRGSVHLDVLAKMGILDQIRAEQTHLSRTTYVDGDGEPVADMPAEIFAGDVEILRGDLGRILFEATKGGTEYLFGDSITALDERADGVHVTFEHAPPRRFDLVIGADGLHSNVRRLAFGREAQFIRHLGPYAAIWDLPETDDMFASGEGFVYSHSGRSVMVERGADGAPARAFLTFSHSAPGTVNRNDTDEVVETVRSVFAEDRWRSGEIIDTLTDAGDFYFDTISQIRMDHWSAGRVALVGDAAYAPAFLSGRSSSNAIYGAFVLATELAGADRPQDAFAAYEHRLRDCVERGQDLALDNAFGDLRHQSRRS
jgi:2-polyprenyl-6-methoxyphenol hydroxylase-like FAD-dependent oxidoreductase